MPSAGIELSLSTWIVLVALGGLLGLDGVSWPQIMASRPLVSASLGGALIGDPGAGVIVGVALEMLALPFQPFGAARYPETGPAGVVAGVAFAASPENAFALAAAVLAGWAVGWIGSFTVVGIRRVNGRILAPARRLVGEPRLLEGRHRAAMVLDFGRAAALTGVFLLPAAHLVRWMGDVSAPGLDAAVGIGLLALVGGSAGAAGREATADSSRAAAALAAGLVAGALLAWIL